MGILEVRPESWRDMGGRVAQASAFSPCHITGFFRIHDQSNDLTHVGSTGAGVSIEPGLTTRVSVRKGQRGKVSVKLNGRPLRNPVVSDGVIEDYSKRTAEHWTVRVHHTCPLPIGRGYGTSGAAAVSLSLALNDALGEPCSRRDALAIAHMAEIRARTGLGTVAAVSEGGLAVRTAPGAPQIGEVRRLLLSRSMRVVSGSFGPISTAGVLSSRKLRSRVNRCSVGLVEGLLRRPDEGNFLAISRRFADCLGLVSHRLRLALDSTDKAGLVASMLMLGDGAFTIVSRSRALEAALLMRQAGLFTVVGRAYSKGASLT